MTPDQIRLLIDHLDESLRGKPTAPLEDIIGDDPEAEKEWTYLHLAVDAVKEAGLYEQVAIARAAWKTEAEPGKTTGARVRPLYRYAVRAAACLLIVTASASIYKYVSVSSRSLYDRYYSSYDLHTTRGTGDTDPIVQAYYAKDWAAVLNLTALAKTRTNQTDFLAGMACLEQKQYTEAITHFEQIIAVNNHAGSDYYQDEAEFYLAIAWLAHKNVNEAMPLLEKIRADRQHKFHEKVAKMSFFDLRLAQFKENK